MSWTRNNVTTGSANSGGFTLDSSAVSSLSADKDLLVVSVSYADAVAFTAASGWNTALVEANGNALTGGSGKRSVAVFWIERGASAPDLVFPRTGGSSFHYQLSSYTWGGTPGTHTLDAVASVTDTTAATAHALSALTIANGETLIVFVAGGVSNPTGVTATSPTTYGGLNSAAGAAVEVETWRGRIALSTGPTPTTALFVADAEKTSAGSTGNFSAPTALSRMSTLAAVSFYVDTGGGDPGPVAGETTATLGAVTSSATGALAIAGAAAVSLGAAVLSSAAGLAIKGQAAVTLGAAAVTAVGQLGLKAALAVSLGAMTGTGAGALPVVANATAALAPLTGTATGALAIVGSSTATLSEMVATGAAALPIASQGSTALDPLTFTATGSLPVTGALDAALGPLTALGTAAFGEVSAGAIDASLSQLSSSSTGALPITGAASVTLGAVSPTANGALLGQGGLSGALDALLGSATGQLAIAGATAVTLDPASLSATGALPVTGELNASLGVLSLSAAGLNDSPMAVTPPERSRASLPQDRGRASLPDNRARGSTFQSRARASVA